MSSPVTTIAEVGKHEGQSVTLRGWLYNLRASGKLLFPQFRDGSGVIQGVVPKNAVTPEVFEAIKTLTQESSVIVEGKVRADKRAPGGYELDVANVQVVQRVPESDPYPITPKEHGVEFLMEHRHLWVRSQRQASILRVRAEIIKAVRDFSTTVASRLQIRRFLPRLPARARAPFSPSIISKSRPTSRSPASFTSKPQRWPWARFIRLVQRFARKNRRRAVTSLNSGWSSRKLRMLSSMT